MRNLRKPHARQIVLGHVIGIVVKRGADFLVIARAILAGSLIHDLVPQRRHRRIPDVIPVRVDPEARPASGHAELFAVRGGQTAELLGALLDEARPLAQVGEPTQVPDFGTRQPGQRGIDRRSVGTPRTVAGVLETRGQDDCGGPNVTELLQIERCPEEGRRICAAADRGCQRPRQVWRPGVRKHSIAYALGEHHRCVPQGTRGGQHSCVLVARDQRGQSAGLLQGGLDRPGGRGLGAGSSKDRSEHLVCSPRCLRFHVAVHVDRRLGRDVPLGAAAGPGSS